MGKSTRLACCAAVVGFVAGGVAVLKTQPLKAQPPPPTSTTPPPPAVDVGPDRQDPFPGPATVGSNQPAPTLSPEPLNHYPAYVYEERGRSNPTPVSPAKSEDPLQAANSYITKTRQEAEASVKALRDEASALRERLKKVESALGRWESLLSALESDVPRRPDRTELVPAPNEPALVPGPGAHPPAAPGGELEAVPSEVRSRPAAPHETL